MNKYTFIDLKGVERTINVGDRVLYTNGSVGIITSICGCERCIERGFCEPTVSYINVEGSNDSDYLSDYYYKANFPSIYKIGNERFNAPPSVTAIETQIEKQKFIIEKSTTAIKQLEQYKAEVLGENNVRTK